MAKAKPSLDLKFKLNKILTVDEVLPYLRRTNRWYSLASDLLYLGLRLGFATVGRFSRNRRVKIGG
jgi:hypothetical protein